LDSNLISEVSSESEQESEDEVSDTPAYKKRKVTFAEAELEEISFSAVSDDEVENENLRKKSEEAAADLNKINKKPTAASRSKAKKAKTS
jgi:hypothetical protein